MGELQVEVDPAEVGMDAGRLERLDRHFRDYVDDGRLPGWLIAVSRHGKLVHVSTYGHADVEAGRPIELDTVFRIYSMTKPITSVAAMMLAEEGRFELKDPVSRFLPAFADQRVYRSGGSLGPQTEPVASPMLVWHLLTHTSGLTYGFHHAHAVDELYRNAGFEWGSPEGLDTAGCVAAWTNLPLLFQPGTEWNYGVSTDVLGHLVEVVSGQRLDEFLRERIFEPLGMHETAFHLPADQQDRRASLYLAGPGGARMKLDDFAPIPTEPPPFLSGGGGLVSTAADYLRFTEMLRRGGELDGVRLLGSRTVAYMRRNHLPGGVDLEAFGRPLFAETTFDGVGFGLGFSVTVDPAALKVPSQPGDYGWGGAASTFFTIDPVDDTVALFMTQLLPSSAHPIRSNLRALVNQALVD